MKAQTYEVLREHGISHCTPHPILLTQTRSCPLLPPPPPEKIPVWKTIRPRKKPEDDQAEESREFFFFLTVLSIVVLVMFQSCYAVWQVICCVQLCSG